MAGRSISPFDLKQKVNFYVSISFIAVFGFFVSITIIHAMNPTAAILKYASSPIEVDLERY